MRPRKSSTSFTSKMKKIDDPVVNMSGGQCQGIAIGRAIYFNARVVIRDEPTAALGPEETRMVGQLIKRLENAKVSASSCQSRHQRRVRPLRSADNHGRRTL
jgi:ABC-type sugar transport system ATPase subunit